MERRRVTGAGRIHRRATGIGLVTGVVVAAAVTWPMTASATPEADTPAGGFASAADATITPGAKLVIPLGGDLVAECTANYLYRSGGRDDGPDGGDHGPWGEGPDAGDGDHGDGDHSDGDGHKDAAGKEGTGKDEHGDGDDDGHGHGHGPGEHPAPPGEPGGQPGGDVFIGTAAHCVSQNEGAVLDGCDEANAPLPLGTPVTVVGTDGEESTATVEYNSWLTMQKAGERDPNACQFNDFALLRLDPDDVAEANPSVPLFGGPTGLEQDGTAFGEPVYSYQPNILPTPAKQGVSLGRPMPPFSHVTFTAPPGVQGDSGSGYLDGDGKAFGVLSSLFTPPNLPVGTVFNGVTDIASALAYANSVGELGDVGLVEGTEPFSPLGVPMTPKVDVPEQALGPMVPQPLLP